MSAAVISTLIFASPGASAFGKTYFRGAANQDAGCSTLVTCQQLAAKRLHLASYFERKRNEWRAVAKRLQARRTTSSRPSAASPARIICSVFGAHCSEAISVATCESHLNVYARNGQYLGLFQFGSFARAHYGFAWDALTQARAAYRYFLDAGWSPWQCRP